MLNNEQFHDLKNGAVKRQNSSPLIVQKHKCHILNLVATKLNLCVIRNVPSSLSRNQNVRGIMFKSVGFLIGNTCEDVNITALCALQTLFRSSVRLTNSGVSLQVSRYVHALVSNVWYSILLIGISGFLFLVF